jgi:hypothetical protein
MEYCKEYCRKIGGFIGKAAPIIFHVVNLMKYLPGRLDTIGKRINKGVGLVDIITGLFAEGICDKVEQSSGRRSTNKYLV